MKSFKKLAVLLLSCLMVLACTATVFAAPSPSAKDTDNVVADADLTFNGNAMEQTAAQNVKADPQAVLTAAGISGDYTFCGVFDIHHTLADGSYDANFAGTVVKTVAVDGVKSGDKIIVLHYLDESDKWVQETVLAVADGQVTIQSANGLSPFAFFKANGTTAASSSSPKTGEMPVAAALLVVAALAGAGMLVSRKKFA